MKTTQHEKLIFNIEELVHKYSINQQQLRLPSSLTLFLGLSGFREISFNSWKSWAPVKTWTTPGTSGRLQISALTRSIQNEQFNPRWMFSDCDGELDYTERKLRHEISSRDQTSDLFCCKARSLPTHPVNTPLPKNKRNPEMKTRILYFQNPYFTVMEINLQVCMVWLSNVLRTITEFYGWLPPSLFENGSMANNEDKI